MPCDITSISRPNSIVSEGILTRFRSNFCRDTKDEWTDKATVGIEAGLIIGGVALALFPPTSPAGAAIVLGACGTAAVIETYWDITDRWPKGQSE